MKMKTKESVMLSSKKNWFIILFLLTAVPSVAAASEVAYIEEITYDDWGNEVVQRYRPTQKPITVSPPSEPRQRDLTDIEKQELYQLEQDFAHGGISESEYNQRKRDLYRSTFVDGYTENDGMFNYSGRF